MKEKILDLGTGEIKEHNIIAASWIDDMATPQQDFERR